MVIIMETFDTSNKKNPFKCQCGVNSYDVTCSGCGASYRQIIKNAPLEIFFLIIHKIIKLLL